MRRFTFLTLTLLPIVLGAAFWTTVTVSGGNTVTVGSTIQLRATSTDRRDAFSWSTKAPSVATVSKQGVVSGVAPGVARIVARGTHSGRRGSLDVTVTRPVVAPPPAPAPAPTPPPPETGARTDPRVSTAYMVSPDILALVFIDRRVQSYSAADDYFDLGDNRIVGDHGAEWQAGPWTVTRASGTGAVIPVTAVNRCSTPAGQNYYDVGYGANTHDNLLDLEHVIYLRLAQPVGSKETLRIIGPFLLTHDFVFDDRTTVTPVIQVNQVGYSPRATQRWAYVSWHLGDGGALPLANFPATADVLRDDAPFLSGLPIAPRSAFDPDTGAEVRQIDLATLPASTGVYRVRIPGVGVSWPTGVNEAAVTKAYYTVVRGLFHNRWAGDLKPEYTTWARPQDHTTVYTSDIGGGDFFPADTPLTGQRPLLGGHHDAGDFDIRSYHRMTGLLLLAAFETTPTAFRDSDLNLPESGNGIPDLLDEALWSVACWEYLQEDDGGVRTGVESHRHPLGIYRADLDPLPYWTYARDPKHTMFCAGLFAHASRLVVPFDAARAAKLRDRAVRAYQYATRNGIGPALGGPTAYAAAELHRLTGESAYLDMLNATLVAASPPWSPLPEVYDRDFPWSSSHESSAGHPYLWPQLTAYLTGPAVTPERLDAARRSLDRSVATVINATNSRAHRNPRPLEYNSPSWGMGVASGRYLSAVFASIELQGLTQDKYNAISLAADYVLGCNPLGRTWITGLGSRPPLDPLHLDSLVAMREGKGSMPGIPVYGPVLDYSAAGYLEYALRVTYPLTQDLPVMRRFGDAHFLVESNEFTTPDIGATHAVLFAALYGVRP